MRNGTKVNTNIGDVSSPLLKNPVSSPRQARAAHTVSVLPATQTGINATEAELLAAYRSASDDGRHDIISAARAVARVSPRRRPTLALVKSSLCGVAV